MSEGMQPGQPPVKLQIYTTVSCGYCRAAKALLAKKEIAYEEIDCGADPALRAWLIEQTGQRTVPQIFVGGTPIGGFTELAALDRAGTLDEMVAGTLRPASIR